jgi:VanZ family protein
MTGPIPIIVHNPARIEAERVARTMRSMPAARYVFVVLLLIESYVSLNTLPGWRHPPQGWLAMFTTSPELKLGDILINFIGYVPIGLFGVLAFIAPRRPLWLALILSVAACTTQSMVTEALESMTPNVRSNIADVFNNAAGALIGGLAAIIAVSLVWSGRIVELRQRHLTRGWQGDIGLALIALWAFAMLAPRTLLFGIGDARFFLGVPARTDLQPAFFLGVEAVVCALSLLGFALLLRLTFSSSTPRLRAMLLLAVFASLAIRSSGFGMFWGASSAFTWLNAGALLGMAIGTVLALALIGLPHRVAGIGAAIALSLSVLIVNASPPNPAVWFDKHLRWQRMAPLAVSSRTTAMLWPAAAIGLALAAAALGTTHNPYRRRDP